MLFAFVCERAFENEPFIPGTSEPNALEKTHSASLQPMSYEQNKQ